MFGGRHSFTHMMNPHYAEIAKAYGIPYDVVIDRKDLQAKVEKMISTKVLTCWSAPSRRMKTSFR